MMTIDELMGCIATEAVEATDLPGCRRCERLEAEVVGLRALEEAAIELVRASDAVATNFFMELRDLRDGRTGSIAIPKDSPAAVAGDRHRKAEDQFWAIARQIVEATEARQVQGSVE